MHKYAQRYNYDIWSALTELCYLTGATTVLPFMKIHNELLANLAFLY